MRFKTLKIYEFTGIEHKLTHEFADVDFSFIDNHGLAVSKDILQTIGQGASISTFADDAISISDNIHIGGALEVPRPITKDGYGYWELT
jgi:hypothetical protein